MTKKEKEELQKIWDKVTFVVEPKKSTIISNRETEERKKNRKKIYKKGR
ncbi:hypothetical protein [Leptotrichia sp. OH3620_COT-345]|nr:hypothetical protein [Leptotrichia sp. OH3620_COT-345]